jgi:hypothetical protein
LKKLKKEKKSHTTSLLNGFRLPTVATWAVGSWGTRSLATHHTLGLVQHDNLRLFGFLVRLIKTLKPVPIQAK